MIHHGPDLITRFRFFGHSNNARRALHPLRQIYKPFSDTMLTWVNNARAKQEYRSGLLRYFELCAGVAICEQIVHGELKVSEIETRPVYKTQQQTSKGLKLQILVDWFFIVNWVQRICCDLL